MALSKEKTRILINLPIDLKEALEKNAKAENRSMSNYIVHILLQHVEQEPKSLK